MLQSMVAAPRPTRAEASDVANAIYDATSAVMLSGETAVGAIPSRRCRTMAEIARAVEADIEREGRAPQPWARARDRASRERSATAPARWPTGWAPRRSSAPRSRGRRPAPSPATCPPSRSSPISPNQRVVNQLALSWGVCPLLGGRRGSFEEVVREANELVLAGAFGRRGQVVVVTAGLQTNQSGKTNLIKAHVLD